MRNLINFFVRFSAWLLFAVYATASIIMLFHSSPYQHHVLLTSANSVVAGVYGTVNSVTSYLHLRQENTDLQRRTAQLESEILQLRAMLEAQADIIAADTITLPGPMARYSFTIAHVINNTTSRPHNYITINRGSADGIAPEMGVIDQNGVVGIVNVVAPHSARVISLLNPDLRLSCKVKGSREVGSLVWDGRAPDMAILEELPRHAVFATGDTIVTSGYSTVFPEGVMVGTVVEGMRDHDENFHTLRIKLFTDFTTLGTVKVVADSLAEEIKAVETVAEPSRRR